MTNPVEETVFIHNLYATPAEWQRDLFYSVVRGGQLKAGPEHRIQRETYPGHELIFCTAGQGWIQVNGKRHEISANDLVWVNCHHPHAYGSVSKQPWELYWIRVEGRPLEKVANLLEMRSQPVIRNIDPEKAS